MMLVEDAALLTLAGYGEHANNMAQAQPSGIL